MRRAVLLSLSLFVAIFLSLPASAQRGGHSAGGGSHAGGSSFHSSGGYHGGSAPAYHGGGSAYSRGGHIYSGHGYSNGRAWVGPGGRGYRGWGRAYPYWGWNWGWGWPYANYYYYPYWDYYYPYTGYGYYYPPDYGYDSNDDPNAEYYDPNAVNDLPPSYQPDPNYPPRSPNNPYPPEYQYRPNQSAPATRRPVPRPPAGTVYNRSQGAQPQTILVYLDGHRQQIGNYAIADNTLYVFGATQQMVPLESLDLEATASLNDQRGVPFRLGSR